MCDPIWHVSSRSSDVCSRTAVSGYLVTCLMYCYSVSLTGNYADDFDDDDDITDDNSDKSNAADVISTDDDDDDDDNISNEDYELTDESELSTCSVEEEDIHDVSLSCLSRRSLAYLL